MHCRILPGRTCKPCGFTMEIRSRCHWLLIFDVKRNTKTDGRESVNNIPVSKMFVHMVLNLKSTFYVRAIIHIMLGKSDCIFLA